jgi:uncharacterized membrane protein
MGVLEIVSTVSGGVITLLLAILSYFFKELLSSIKNLNISIQQLELNQKIQSIQCTSRSDAFEDFKKRVNMIENQMHSIGHDIEFLKKK